MNPLGHKYKQGWSMPISNEITQDKWTVTLFCDRGSQHARLAIHGIDNVGKVVKKMLDFRGATFLQAARHEDLLKIHWQDRVRSKGMGILLHSNVGRVNMDDKTEDEDFSVRFTKKTRNYLCRAERVQEMINAAQQEVDYLENPIGFHICGKNSVLFNDNPNPIAYRTTSRLIKLLFFSNAQKHVMKAYHFAKRHINDLNGTTIPEGSEEGVKYNPVSRFGRLKFVKDDHDDLIDNLKLEFFKGKSNKYLAKAEFILNDEVEFIKFKKQFNITNDEIEILRDKIIEYRGEIGTNMRSAIRHFLRHLVMNIEEVEVERENCMTWVREKLEIVGIHLEEQEDERWKALSPWAYVHSPNPRTVLEEEDIQIILDPESPSEDDVFSVFKKSGEENSEVSFKDKKSED